MDTIIEGLRRLKEEKEKELHEITEELEVEEEKSKDLSRIAERINEDIQNLRTEKEKTEQLKEVI